MSTNKYMISNLYISNFKAFKPSYPPLRVSFTNSEGNPIHFMMLSGYNGYGKTSIFQAIEFILNGSIEIFSFRDTTKRYTEHISINKINEESLLALELRNSHKGEYISLIRFSKSVKSCTEAELVNGDKNFKLYLIKEKFDYKKFREMFEQNLIEETLVEDVAKIFGEKNFDEWLKSNFLRQEQTSNLLFKSNKERVNFINKLIEMDYEECFECYKNVRDEVVNEIKIVTDTLNTLKKNISQKQDNIIGEKPDDFTIFNNNELVWDKYKYSSEENFEEYIRVLEDIRELNNEIDRYIAHDRIEGINNLLKQPEIIKNILVYDLYSNNLKSYQDSYLKRDYIISFVKDNESILGNEINELYFETEMIERIKILRQNSKYLDKMKSDKDKVYQDVMKIRNQLISNKKVTIDLFSDVCPLCGCDYSKSESSLLDVILRYQELYEKIIVSLDSNSKELQKNLDKNLHILKKDILESIKEISVEKEIYDRIVIIDGNANKYNTYLKRLKFLIEKDQLPTKNSKNIDVEKLENSLMNMLSTLEASLVKNTLFLSNRKLDEKELLIMDGNRNLLQKIYDIGKEELENKLNKKRELFHWYSLRKQFNKYSKDLDDYKKNYQILKEKHIKKIKLSKMLDSVKNAKNQYLSDLIRFIEIPLFIYSGKLLQTHQNGLGVYCTTGKNENNVTQFKLTTDANISGHDIVNKFSSGQKAVMNIAIILAFRKIRVSALDFFMIDDPCQSMDDINIASLTEILRKEFVDTQILISTHDDTTAGYMCYKYSKAGKASRNFNVQNEFYPIVSSRLES